MIPPATVSLTLTFDPVTLKTFQAILTDVMLGELAIPDFDSVIINFK